MADAVREVCVRDSSVSNRRARVVYGPNEATRASGPLESELVVRRPPTSAPSSTPPKECERSASRRLRLRRSADSL